jgi:hypothetical protein
LGDGGPSEKRGAVAFGVDDLVELLDLVAEFDGQRVGLKLTGVADGFHVSGIYVSGLLAGPSTLLKLSG